MNKKYPAPNNGPRRLEIPFAYYNLKEGNVLDIGQSNSRLQKELIKEGRKITVIDPDKEVTERSNIEYHIGDIRKLTTKDTGLFDNVLLISTIEHIGLPCYGQEKSWEDSPFEEQFRCLKHCFNFLKAKGRLILTMPIGEPVDEPNFQLLYTPKMLDQIKKEFKVIKEEYITFDPKAVRPGLSKFWKCEIEECPRYAITKPNTLWGVAMFVIERN